MNEIPLAQLPVEYARLMDEARARVQIARDLIYESWDERHDFRGFVKLESAYLQTRKICELIAIAVLLAHNDLPQFRSKDFANKWNADAIFGLLSKVNPKAFPSRVEEDFNASDVVVIVTDGYLTRDEFKKIYATLGSRLHAGTLASLGQTKDWQIEEAGSWLQTIFDLIVRHVVELPYKDMFMTTSLGTEEGKVQSAIWIDESGPNGERGMRCLHTS